MTRPLIWGCLLLAIIAVAQYSNTFKHGYVFDDNEFITYNPHLSKGLAAIPIFFTQSYTTDAALQGIYRPVLLSSFAIEQAIFGNQPLVRHVCQVVYFALVCLLLYALLYRLFGASYGSALPFLTVLLFALHPIHVEVVANLKSRDELLMLLFGLLSLHSFLSYWRAADDTTVWWRGGALLACLFCLFLSYLSKRNAFTILGLYPLLAWYASPNQAATASNSLLRVLLVSRKTWWAVGTFFVGIALFIVWLKLFKTNPSSEVVKMSRGILGNPLFADGISWAQYTATIVYIWGRNLYLLLVPYPLVYHTGYNYIPLMTWFSPQVWLSLVACVGIALWAARDLPQRGLVGFGLAWYMITISIYGQVVRLAPDLAADRFLFTPSVGSSWVLIAALAQLTRTDMTKSWRAIWGNMPFAALLFALFVAYFLRTYVRNEVWKDNYTLFSSDMPLLEQSARPHAYLANELVMRRQRLGEQKTEQRRQLHDQAVRHYERAISIAPFSDELYLAYTRALLKMGKRDTALQIARRMTNLDSDSYLASLTMGDVCFEREEYAQALPYLRRVLHYNPQRTKGYELLAWAYYKNESPDSAHVVLDTALVRFPKNAFFWREKGKMLYLKEDTLHALPYLLKADSLKNRDRETLHMLATSYATLGDTATAKRYAKQFNQTLPQIYQ
ncbi:MAG: tetratricopeptide repeat protein [Chitinophagales bacterium]|nr:tetratricopeptide repeat protein [Chitinophagales bacterium]